MTNVLKRSRQEIHLDNNTDPNNYIVSGNTFKYKEQLKELGGKWEKTDSTKHWKFAKGTTDQSKLSALVDKLQIREFHIRSTASKKSHETIKEKGYYKEHKADIDYKLSEIRKINKRVFKEDVIDVPKNGFCAKCKKNWCIRIIPSDYETKGLSSCPLCFNSWI